MILSNGKIFEIWSSLLFVFDSTNFISHTFALKCSHEMSKVERPMIGCSISKVHGLGLMWEWVSRKQEKLVLVNVVPKDFNDKKLFEVEFVYCMLILG